MGERVIAENTDEDILSNRLKAIQLYPDELTGIDHIGETGYLEKVVGHFGTRHIRGSAIAYAPDGKRITETHEPFLRAVFSQLKPKCAVEIGTLFGVTTALLAHYAEEVVTVDIYYQQVASYVKHYFGVADKIRSVIVVDDVGKKAFLSDLDFDFAFIDAEHTYEGVKLDFECVKKCGHVLFHDYGLENHPGIAEFVNKLPPNEIYTRKPFAYWEKS